MNRHLALLVVPLAFWLLLLPPPAQAATTCSASMSNLSFGTVDPFSGAVSATATLNYSCTSTTLLGVIGAQVRMCFSIGSGASGTGALAPRRLRSEEHTSELQSLMRISYAVSCLQKKNTNTINQTETNK